MTDAATKAMSARRFAYERQFRGQSVVYTDSEGYALTVRARGVCRPRARPWRELREVVIKRAKGLCERCAANGISRNGRTVNHKNREDGGRIVAPDQLEFLCPACDNRFHSEKGDHAKLTYK